MRSKNPIFICLLFLLGALLLTGLNSFVLSHRTETFEFVEKTTCGTSETVRLTPGTPQNTDKSAKIYLCGMDAEHHDSSKRFDRRILTEEEMPFVEKFYIEIRKSWKLTCSYGESAYCHDAGDLTFPANEEDFYYPALLAADEFAIQLTEDNRDNSFSLGVILAALGLLISGLVYGWKNRKQIPHFRFKLRDGFIAFPLSIALGIFLSYLPQYVFGFALITPLPIMSMSHFGMFVGLFCTSVFYLCLRRVRKEEGQEEGQEKKDVAESGPDDAPLCLRMSPMAFAPIAGFVLALVAMFSTLTVDNFTMTPDDLASQFTGQRLVLCHFAIIAGISEELLYRGVIQTSIAGNKTHGRQAILGMLVAAFFFTLVHVPQSTGHLLTLFPVGLVGLTSGYARYRSQSIFPSMTLHLTYNTTLLIPTLFV